MCAELQLKLKQKYEKMEKQRENSARVDSILIQLMKKHAPEIAEKLENNTVAAAAARAAGHDGAGKLEGPMAANGVTHDKSESVGTAATAEVVKRQKVT